MNLVGGYGSSGEDSSGDEAAPAVVPAPAPKAAPVVGPSRGDQDQKPAKKEKKSKKEKKEKKGKRKTITLSLVPEIQAALEGRAIGSDSEDEYTPMPKKHKGVASLRSRPGSCR